MQKIIRHLFCQPHMARRIVVLILSVTIMGACVSVFDRIQFGTDPASVLNLGVANKLHMLLGTYQMLFYGALLIVVMAMGVHRPGVDCKHGACRLLEGLVRCYL